MRNFFINVVRCAAVLIAASSGFAETTTSRSGVTITAAPDGHYSVQCQNPAWNFAGDLGQRWNHLALQKAKDDGGAYTEIKGDLADAGITAAIRVYDERPVVLFSWTTARPAAAVPIVFPKLTTFPMNLHAFSYGKGPFAPPSFKLEQGGTPWILFDDAANTAILSPASDFMIAGMKGSLEGSLASDLNPGVANLPAGFTHETLLAVGPGIHATALTWGRALSEHLHAARPTNESDVLLKYFGYWTDNGAAYYYKYDLAKGYARTLADVMKSYHDEQIPLHYLQLDSWWYQKSFKDVAGKTGKSKNAKLPEGAWNRYGGTLEYRADPFLFPDGLASWQKSIDLPLVVHGRWIDAESPYQREYRISTIAPIDPKYWDDTAAYLHDSGVTCYEQDWLNEIYDHSPGLQTDPDAGNVFTDNMARATQDRGMTMQYCMAPARFFLQGAKYPNLTTIRVNQDRFERKKWQSFLDASLLAEATGRWPWVDVFMSGETDNLLLSVLSAGPVGTGDAMGKEHRDNLMKAIRPDGVIVKPDAPIVRVDASFIADANGKKQPLLASTYTDHDGVKTIYAFAFMRAGDSPRVSFTPAEMGSEADVYVYERSSSSGRLLKATETFSTTLDPKGAGYYVLAPVTKCGIALLGDRGKFVSTGRERIAAMKDGADSLTVTVLAVPSLDKEIVLHGFAPKKPAAAVTGGTADAVEYDPASRHFSVKVHPAATAPAGEDSTVRVAVRFSME